MFAVKVRKPNLIADPDTVLVLNEDNHDKDAVVAFALDALGERRNSYHGIVTQLFEDDKHVLVKFYKD